MAERVGPGTQGTFPHARARDDLVRPRTSVIGSVAEFVPPDFDVPLVLQASEFVPQLSGRFPTGRGLFAVLGALEGLSETNIAAQACNREA